LSSTLFVVLKWCDKMVRTSSVTMVISLLEMNAAYCWEAKSLMLLKLVLFVRRAFCVRCAIQQWLALLTDDVVGICGLIFTGFMTIFRGRSKLFNALLISEMWRHSVHVNA